METKVERSKRSHSPIAGRVSNPVKKLKPDEGEEYSKPTIKALQRSNIISCIGPKWYELGIALLDNDQMKQLKIIEANKNEVTRCCAEMLMYWLESHSNATWNDLVEALQAPGVELNNVATMIVETFTVQSRSVSTAVQTDHQNRYEHDGTQQIQSDQNLSISKPQNNASSGTTVSFAEFDTVSEAFVFLTSQLRMILMKTHFPDLQRSCIEQMKTPGGAQLPPELVTTVKSCQNLTKLFEVLADSAYWSWIDIRLLKAMAAASGLFEAIQLLSNYRKAIFSKKLINVIPNAPSKEIKEKYYTMIVTKLNKSSKEMTVADLLEFQSQMEAVILDINKGTCTLDHLEKGCIEVYWYIPTSFVNVAYLAAKARCYQFSGLHLQYLKIGEYPVIYGSLASPDVVSFPSMSVNVATVKGFINHYYDYLSINMDAAVVTQLMVTQQLLREDIVKDAFNNYQTNCLILHQLRKMDIHTLVSFSELLQTTDSHKHIGKMLIEGLGNVNTSTEDIEQKVKVELSTETDKFDPSSVITEFLNTKAKLEELLQLCDPTPIVKKCGSLLASETEDIPLFPTDHVEKFQETEYIPELIQKLSPFMTWDNHSILNAIAESSNIPEAIMLLAQFDYKLDTSQPLTSFPIPAPSHHMVPYPNSTHTILAVKLDFEIYHCTLQNIIDVRSLIQEQCKVTTYCLQLLAIAKTNPTIIYWMIPNNITHLITANALRFQKFFYKNGILQLAVYPGVVLSTGSTLKVGPLSFLNPISVDNKQPTINESYDFNVELSQLEEIPQIMSKLHKEIYNATAMVTKMNTIKEEGLLWKEQLIKTEFSEGIKAESSLPEEKVGKQKYSHVLGRYKDVWSSTTFDSDEQEELAKLQMTTESIRSNLAKVKEVKKYWGDKVQNIESVQLPSKEDEQAKFTEDLTVVSKLKKLNSSLIIIENWSEIMELLQRELSDSKQEVEHLKSQLLKLQEYNVIIETQLRQALRNPSSDMVSPEMMRSQAGTSMQQQMSSTRLIPSPPSIMGEELPSTSRGQFGHVMPLQFPGYPQVSQGNLLSMGQQQQTQSHEQHQQLQQQPLMPYVGMQPFPSVVPPGEPIPQALHNPGSGMVSPGMMRSQAGTSMQQQMNRTRLIPPPPSIMGGELPSTSRGQFGHVMPLQFPGDPQVPQGNLISLGRQQQTQYQEQQQQLQQQPLMPYVGMEPFPSAVPPGEPITVRMQMLQPPVESFPQGSPMVTELPPNWTTPAQPLLQQSLLHDIQSLWTGDSSPMIPPANVINMTPSTANIQGGMTVPGGMLDQGGMPSQPKTWDKLTKGSPSFAEALQSHHYHIKWTSCCDIPCKLYDASVAVSSAADNVYVTAGDASDDNTLDNVYCYNTNTDHWTVLPQPGHHRGVLHMLDDKLTIFGGFDPVTQCRHNKVTTYNNDTNSWYSEYPDMLNKRDKPGVITYNNYVIVMGGGSSPDNIHDNIEVMDYHNVLKWKHVSVKLPVPMWNIKTTISGDNITIVGYSDAVGCNNGYYQIAIEEILDQPLSTSATSNQWKELSPTPYYDTATVPYSNPPVIIGGGDIKGVPTCDITLYDSSKNSWRKVYSLKSARKHVGVALLNSNSIIVIGGTSGGSGVEESMACSLTTVEIGNIVVNQ